ncbi:MAG: glycosyltransferase [Micavibrio sp.]|nr:glycosyltransferase [Micavibrio sp.]
MKASIIVCTRNRASALLHSLHSIVRAMQSAAPAETELVLVNNGSTDNTADIVGTWAKGCGVPVRIINEPRKGLSVARNAGLAVARGESLIFTDDDCTMDPDYIMLALKYAGNDRVPTIRGGRTELGDATDLPLTIKTDLLPRRMQLSTDSPQSRYIGIGNMVFGCNMIFHRSLLQTVGKFDERLGAGTHIPGGEETDYLYRAYLKDIPIEYAPDLVIHHFHGRKSLADGYKLFNGYSLGGGALYLKYLFINAKFCRPFYWDLKKAAKELFLNKNTFMPFIDFSYRDMILCNVKGIFLFASALLQGKRAYRN